MLNLRKSIFAILTISLFSFNLLLAEDIGKIFTKAEADQLFGPVLESKTMSTAQLQELSIKTNRNIMFLLKNNQITILGDSRKLIYSSDKFTDENQVFHLYSLSKVVELIYKAGKDTVQFENRKDVFTITSGEYTLEVAAPCPPYCG